MTDESDVHEVFWNHRITRILRRYHPRKSPEMQHKERLSRYDEVVVSLFDWWKAFSYYIIGKSGVIARYINYSGYVWSVLLISEIISVSGADDILVAILVSLVARSLSQPLWRIDEFTKIREHATGVAKDEAKKAIERQNRRIRQEHGRTNDPRR